MNADARPLPDDEPLETDEDCVFGEPDCGPPVMYDYSGEPWCAKCRDRARREAIAAGLNDPESPLQ